MRRAAATALALACVAPLLLGACPLPQPLASVGREDGGTITPPRILPESAVPRDTVIRVLKTCSPATFQMSAQVEDLDTTEAVEARWFLDYTPASPSVLRVDTPVGSSDPTDPLRALPPADSGPFQFSVPAFDGSVPVHVLEVVVSNGFYGIGQDPPGSALPNRTPQPNFETQAFRWVFEYVDQDGRCQ